MTAELATNEMTDEKIDLIRRTICKDASPDELALFLGQCRRTGLDAFSKQVYAVFRFDGKAGRKVMTIQTGIDGFRLIAARTGEYEGQVGPFWCGKDGVWKDIWLDDGPPFAAKVGVLRRGFREPTWGVARFAAYSQPTPFWTRMGDGMIAKCFTPDTQILTDAGFQRLDSVSGRVMQVTDGGLELTDATPFVQPYAGEMVVSNGDMLNFAVTPNHDMVTTFGKVEAGAMYATTRTRGVWDIPLTHIGVRPDAPVADEALRLAGYIVADGCTNNGNQFRVAVSRDYKTHALRSEAADSVCIQHSRGAVADAGVRVIRTNFDKTNFGFDHSRVAGLIDTEKRFNLPMILTLSARQCRVLFDAWQLFDGYTNRKTGTRRLYTSRLDHLGAAELLAVMAGYTVNSPRTRFSDISDRPNYVLAVSGCQKVTATLPFGRRPGLVVEPNTAGQVWCVTVPSGVVVVRRNGFSMLCGNCAEAIALRKSFPQELSGLYTAEEMDQADRPEVAEATPRAAAPRQIAAAPAPATPDNPTLAGLIAAAIDAAGDLLTLADAAKLVRDNAAKLSDADKAGLRADYAARTAALKAAAPTKSRPEAFEPEEAETVASVNVPY